MLTPGAAPAGLVFAITPARRGFVWRDLGVALLPDTQVFRRRPPRATAPAGRALAELLRPPHRRLRRPRGPRDRAAARFRDARGRRVTRDYLLLGFSGDDRVYVPHEQIGKVSRYIGADSKAPTLSKLGGKSWDNLKTRARDHLREMAGELLALYAQRQTQPGIAYDTDHEWVERLEAEFPFRETETRRRRSRPSRRISRRRADGPARLRRRRLRQDRGRAAGGLHRRRRGKQVLILVPTMLLAQQHWNTFRDRFRDFPVRVEMVSRFRKPAEVSGAGRFRRGEGRRPDRDAPRALAAT